MSAEERREQHDLRAGDPREQDVARCRIDGGAFQDEGDAVRCERCALDPETAATAAADRSARYELVAVYHDGNPETWARFTDPGLALDVADRIRRSMRVPFVGVGDRERDGHGWISEDDLEEPE